MADPGAVFHVCNRTVQRQNRALAMGDVVNLNDRRKQKARQQKSASADSNRLKFGRTKGEKQRDEKDRTTNIRTLDNAKRDKDEPEGK
jgi:hypothetical protein